MRIGIDVRLWSQTGIGRYIRNLVVNLQKIDKKNEYILFFLPQDLSDIKSRVRSQNFKTVESNIRWHSFSEQTNFPSVIYKENIDLMHFPYFSVPILYRKPYVITIHDLIINHFSTGKASTLFYPVYLLKREVYKFIIRIASKNAKKIITPSISTKSEIIDHLNVREDKILVTYEAPDNLITTSNSTNFSKKYGKYFLYVGNAYPHKNLDKLLEAFNKLSNEVKNLKLILVGKRDYFYNKFESKNKNSNIIFYGKANDSELSSLYRNALALIMPSFMEGFGLPIVEAMMNKCLVICSDIPAFREIIGNSAIFFDPKNMEEIAGKLKLVANEEVDKNKMIEEGYKKVKLYSWEKMAEETLDIYKNSI